MSLDRKYHPIVQKAVVAATAAGPLGAFTGPFDMAAVGTIWTTMFLAMADKAAVKVDGEFAKKFVVTAGTGAAGYIGGCKLATMLFHLIPGAGTLTAMGVSSAINAIYTLKFAHGIGKLFEKREFGLVDAADAATVVLAVLCTMPRPAEFQEVFHMKNEA
jgi:hypothetical protein